MTEIGLLSYLLAFEMVTPSVLWVLLCFLIPLSLFFPPSVPLIIYLSPTFAVGSGLDLY